MFCVDWFSRIGVVLDGAEFFGAEGRCRLGSGRRGMELLGTVVQAWTGMDRCGKAELGRARKCRFGSEIIGCVVRCLVR